MYLRVDIITKEAPINIEFPQHMDVLPFSMTDKQMKKKRNSISPFFTLMFMGELIRVSLIN